MELWSILSSPFCPSPAHPHGSGLLSRGQLFTVEAPGRPRHPSSIQLDAVVSRLARVHLRRIFLRLFEVITSKVSDLPVTCF